MTDVVVVGSANLDLVVRTETRPDPGETTLGEHYEEFVGGKGLNQSVAAARLAPTALVACVGEEPAGRAVEKYARRRGVDTSHVSRSSAPTGRAVIVVTPDGENSIIVVAGANMELGPSAIEGALTSLDPRMVVIQREISDAATMTVIEWTRANDVRLLVNPSPARRSELEWFGTADPLVVNLHEARLFVGEPSIEAPQAARQLAKLVRSVVVTSGPHGAWIVDASGEHFVGAVPVHEVYDTTGAGDEFAGTVAATLARGGELVAAVQAGAAAASKLVGTPRVER